MTKNDDIFLIVTQKEECTYVNCACISLNVGSLDIMSTFSFSLNFWFSYRSTQEDELDRRLYRFFSSFTYIDFLVAL